MMMMIFIIIIIAIALAFIIIIVMELLPVNNNLIWQRRVRGDKWTLAGLHLLIMCELVIIINVIITIPIIKIITMTICYCDEHH